MHIISIEPAKKGELKIEFESGMQLFMYKKEIAPFHLEENMDISDDVFEEIYRGILGKRVKKRAMFLLEKMDRTKHQLEDKLKSNAYPQELIDEAIAYVESYGYLDDKRYAENYIGFRQNTKSRTRIKMELFQKGVDKEIIEEALNIAYENDEIDMIKQILKKKKYYDNELDLDKKRKLHQSLLRKGFKNSDIKHAMKCEEYLT